MSAFEQQLESMLDDTRRGKWRLTDEQYELARRAVIKRENVYYCGEGGSGKTHLAECILDLFGRLGVPCMAVAPSGQAAQLLGGFTIHQAFGLLPQTRVKDGRATGGHNELRKSWKLRNDLRKTRVIVLDEVSMVSAPLFEDMVRRITMLRGRNAGAFGGVQVIGLGDPLQLPPVGKEGTPDARYCFESPQWAHVFPPTQCFRLQRQMRQSAAHAGNEQFALALAELRRGRCPPEVSALLRSRMYTRECAPDFRTTPYLFATRDETDTHNRLCMDTYKVHPTTWHAETYLADGYEFLESNLRFDLEVVLKPGLPVVLTKNFDVVGGLVNGTRGTVLRIATTCELGLRRCANPRCLDCLGLREDEGRPKYQVMEFQDESDGRALGAALSRFVPIVRFNDRDDHVFAVLPATSAIKSRTRTAKPRAAGPGATKGKRAAASAKPDPKRVRVSLAQLAPAGAAGLPAPPHGGADGDDPIEETNDGDEGPSVLACREQMPLVVAFGFTIHKVQGMTLDCACICWDRVFAAGQVYVALSRVRSLDSVSIMSTYVPVSRITMSEKAIEFEARCLPVLSRHPALASSSSSSSSATTGMRMISRYFAPPAAPSTPTVPVAIAARPTAAPGADGDDRGGDGNADAPSQPAPGSEEGAPTE